MVQLVYHVGLHSSQLVKHTATKSRSAFSFASSTTVRSTVSRDKANSFHWISHAGYLFPTAGNGSTLRVGAGRGSRLPICEKLHIGLDGKVNSIVTVRLDQWMPFEFKLHSKQPRIFQLLSCLVGTSKFCEYAFNHVDKNSKSHIRSSRTSHKIANFTVSASLSAVLPPKPIPTSQCPVFHVLSLPLPMFKRLAMGAKPSPRKAWLHGS